MERKSTFSACRRYRYCLWREWGGEDKGYAMFIGLNPSTADEKNDDPTIRRCVAFAKQWGYGALCMMNLFAFRATKPGILKDVAEAVGPDNDSWLKQCAKDAGIIVLAWGTKGTHLRRDEEVIRLLAGRLSCLGLTQAGHPKHPLYVPARYKPRPYA